MSSLETVNRNLSAEATNKIISVLQERVPQSMGIPLKPEELAETVPVEFPRHQEKIRGHMTGRRDIAPPVGSIDTIQHLAFEADGGETWTIFRVIPSNESVAAAYVWRQDADPARIEYGVSGNDGLDYDPRFEQSTLQAVADSVR
jgi:hypothetical protein